MFQKIFIMATLWTKVIRFVQFFNMLIHIDFEREKNNLTPEDICKRRSYLYQKLETNINKMGEGHKKRTKFLVSPEYVPLSYSKIFTKGFKSDGFSKVGG